MCGLPIRKRVARRLPPAVRRGGRALLGRFGRGRAEPFGLWATRWGTTGQQAPPFQHRMATYQALRRVGGIARAADGTWLVGSHPAVKAVFRDDERFTLAPRAVFGPISEALAGVGGGARHLAIRAPLVAALSPRGLGDRGPWIREVARSTLAAMAGPGAVDMEGAFARPLAMRLLGDLIGFEDVPTEALLTWAPHTTRYAAAGPTGGGAPDASFRAAVAAARARAQGPALHEAPVLAALAEADEVMASEESFGRATAILLLAGVETTRMTILNTLYALLDHPEAEAEVRADRARLPAVVAETLRLKPSDAVIAREAAHDTDLAGHAIAAGDRLACLTEAANRDPAVVSDPDAFRLDRPSTSLAFGYGPHFCPGHFWARAEVLGAIEVVLDAWPSLQDARVPAEGPGPFLDRNPGPLWFHSPPAGV